MFDDIMEQEKYVSVKRIVEDRTRWIVRGQQSYL